MIVTDKEQKEQKEQSSVCGTKYTQIVEKEQYLKSERGRLRSSN